MSVCRNARCDCCCHLDKRFMSCHMSAFSNFIQILFNLSYIKETDVDIIYQQWSYRWDLDEERWNK